MIYDEMHVLACPPLYGQTSSIRIHPVQSLPFHLPLLIANLMVGQAGVVHISMSSVLVVTASQSVSTSHVPELDTSCNAVGEVLCIVRDEGIDCRRRLALAPGLLIHDRSPSSLFIAVLCSRLAIVLGLSTIIGTLLTVTVTTIVAVSP